MATKAPDRRVKRTRHLLQQALFALILEQEYEHITVQHIIDRANVGRATFYAHYHDKQHLFVSGFADLRAQLKHACATHHANGALHLGFSLPMFEHVLGYRQLWRALMGQQSGAIVHAQIQQVLTEVVRDDITMLAAHRAEISVPTDLLVEYIVGAFMGMLLWWANHDSTLTASHMDAMFQQLARSGLLGTGLDKRDVRG